LPDADPDANPELEELVRAVRELTRRVEQLERRFNDDLTDTRDESARRPIPIPSRPSTRLESRIGSQWLNRIGVVAVLFGVAYLLRYVFLNQWVSAATWIWLGVSAGIVVILASEAFRRRGYRVLSISLKATGIGVTYLSLWAGFELYKVLSGAQAFSGILIITVAGAVLALRESSEVLAALALIGGFLAPLLIAIPSGQVALFLYIAMLDVSAAVLTLRRDWRSMVPVAFCGTVVVCTVWYFGHYNAADLAPAAVAATAYFAMFCATAAAWQRRLAARSRLLLIFEVINPGVYISELYLLLSRTHHDALASAAFGVSALYFGLAWSARRRATLGGASVPTYGGLGIAFIAVALAIVLDTGWLSLGWFVEAAIVIAIGFGLDLPWLRWGALLLLCAAIVKAFAFDVWQLGLGYRTLSFIGLGVLLLVISFAYQRYGFSIAGKTDKGFPGRLP
jgi:uncharacterized membrane protein